jgi:tetratricopeptide (TPR) repeat protein
MKSGLITFMKRILLCAVMLSAACVHRQQRTPTPVPQSGSPEHLLAYLAGLSAFREATPEGYQRAAIAFRRASVLERESCEYVLHLAEALYFLAQQQKLNWEDYSDSLAEANTILEFKRVAPGCHAFESQLSRLRALSMTFSGGRIADAVAVMRHALTIDPQDPLNWIVLGQLNPRPPAGESRAPLAYAVELAPDLPLAHYELGSYQLTNAATYGIARQAFERAIELSPRHFQSLIGIVYSLSSEGDDAVNRIEGLLRRCVEIAPRFLKGRTLLGDYFAGLEETEQAVEQYQSAISLNPRYYPAHLAKGIALVTGDRSAEAEQAFRAVLELEVKRPHPPYNGVDFAADGQAHYYLGNLRLERGELAQARAEYVEAVNDVSNYAPAIYGLGIVSYREGKVDESLGHFDQVIQSNPRQFPNAYLVRGGIRAERRQFSESLRDINTAIEIYQQQILSLESKAQADEAKGWKRRADAQRRRKALIEATLEKAIESKKTVETLMGRGGI